MEKSKTSTSSIPKLTAVATTTPRFCDAVFTPATDATLAMATLAEARRTPKLLPSPQKALGTAREVEAEADAAAVAARAMVAEGAAMEAAAMVLAIARVCVARVTMAAAFLPLLAWTSERFTAFGRAFIRSKTVKGNLYPKPILCIVATTTA